MNAVNPVPSPASGAEPSMEEILASIRRIIADDQPLPRAAAPEPALREPAARETMRAEAAAAKVTAETPVESMPPEQGMVATPQFPTPEGPVAGVMDTPHPLAPAAPEAPAPTAAHVALPEPDLHEATLRHMHDDEDARAAVVNAAHDHVYEGQFFEEPLQEEPVAEPPAREVPRHQPAAEEAPLHAAGEVPPFDRPGAGLFSAATSQSLAAAFNTLAISRLADDSDELRGLARDMLRPLLKDWLDAHLPGLVESIIREEIDRMARRTR